MLLGAIVAVIVAVVFTPQDTFAAQSLSHQGKAPRSIAVSVPPDPVPLGPGATGTIPIRVVNPGATPVTVTVTGRGLQFGNNGKFIMTNSPDPQWAGRVDFPAGDLTLPAQSYDDVSIAVRMPAVISPDLYFIGFVVSPVPTGTGSVVLVNQIGAFVTIDVPGPRVRMLSAHLDFPGFNLGPIHIASLTVGSETAGALRVRNVGHAAVRFWGWNDSQYSLGGGTPTQQRIERSLLPTGLARSFAIVAKPTWPIDFVTMNVYVVHSGKTEAATEQIVRTQRMLVISPWVILGACLIVALGVWWGLRARKRRKAPPRTGRGPAHRVASGRTQPH